MRKIKILTCPSNPEYEGMEFNLKIDHLFRSSIFVNNEMQELPECKYKDAGFVSERDAVLIAFVDPFTHDKSPIGVQQLTIYARNIREKYITDGTVTRRLRELKAEGKINYEFVKKDNLYYRKPLSLKHATLPDAKQMKAEFLGAIDEICSEFKAKRGEDVAAVIISGQKACYDPDQCFNKQCSECEINK